MKAVRHLRRFTTFFAVLAALAFVLPPAVAQAQSGFEPFVAGGPVAISLGTGIKPAGQPIGLDPVTGLPEDSTSGRFVVPSRRAFGLMVGTSLGSVTAPVPYMVQFATNVPIDTQSGNIHGTLYICETANLLSGPAAIFSCLDPVELFFGPVPFPLSLDTAPLLEGTVTRTARVHLVSQIGLAACPPADVDPNAQPYCFPGPGGELYLFALGINGVFTFVNGGTQGHGDANGSVVLLIDQGRHIVGLANTSNLQFNGEWNP